MRFRVLLAALSLGGCAHMAIPRDDIYTGFMIENARGGFVFAPCEVQTREYWLPMLQGAAKEDMQSIQRRGVTRTPQGAFVKIFGITSIYNDRTAEYVITRTIQVSKVVLQPGESCPAGAK